MCREKHDHIAASGVPGGDATRLLEHVSEEVALLALPWALLAATGQLIWFAPMSLATKLRLVVPPQPPP
jgi:hypothetical protein